MQSIQKTFESELLEQFSDFKNGDAYLVLVKPGDFFATRNALIKHLILDLKLKGIYSSSNKPSTVIKRELEMMGIDTSKHFFVDFISRENNLAIQANNVFYLRSPTAFTSAAILTVKLSKNFKFDFLFDDSLTTSLIYNRPRRIQEFIHFVLGKIELLNARAVLIALDDQKTREMVMEISQFFTKIIVTPPENKF
ncbi:MAG: hypothetical protein J4224_01070 [Candidatus Diapherotrites archaeon]|uniref:KaiC-like domain-containing protein n=1 Tax=Candidatus Iainarchaeum sp. TaxID=3101447 RepID=A0A8T4KV77_9ARCH|nr:MAG: hypothetical protein QT03_C0001G0681 [archaeon GW2011_AR10]MBS3058998.1 hypothetical protein [Candidatus Diapherotrites archaeon]